MLKRGSVDGEDLRLLRLDQRVAVFETDQLTPEWITLSRKVAGTVVATADDPMSALVYAVTGGLRGQMILTVRKRFAAESTDLRRAGATACLTMPLNAARVERLVRTLAGRSSVASVDATLRFLADPVSRMVRHGDRCVELTQREIAVLDCLSAHTGRPVAAHKLMTQVWGGEPRAGTRPRLLLDVYICQLRKKLARIGLAGAIRTVRGLGYVMGGTAGTARASTA